MFSADLFGPAILIFNDGIFTEKDFESIQHVGDSQKREVIGKVGKFGVGFNSNYHFTEVPSFISKNYITWFDPQGLYLKNINSANPGKRLDFLSPSGAKLVSSAPRSFEPFKAFGVSLTRSFDGTLFRFPLRTQNQASKSKICKHMYNSDDVDSLFSSFQKDAESMLLFQKSIEIIELYIWNENVIQPELVFRVRITECQGSRTGISKLVSALSNDKLSQAQGRKIPDHVEVVKMNIEETIYKDVQTGGASPIVKASAWVVVSQLGGSNGNAGKMARDPQLNHLRLLPWGAVAANISIKTSVQGRAFCFLPLPCLTGLPLHIHGFFELSQNRRDIWTGNDMAGDGRMKALWNQFLIEDIIADCYCRLLLGMSKQLPLVRFFSLWPGKDISAPWNVIVPSFYRRAILLPLFFSYTNNGRWLTAKDAVFLPPQWKSLNIDYHLTDKLNNRVINMETNVYDGCIMEGVPAVLLDERFASLVFDAVISVNSFPLTVLTSSFVRDMFIAAIKRVNMDSKKLGSLLDWKRGTDILRYVFNDITPTSTQLIIGLPLLPLANTSWGIFEAVSSSRRIFVASDDELFIFKKAIGLFLHPDFSKLIQSKGLVGTTNIYNLTINDTRILLEKCIPWACPSLEIQLQTKMTQDDELWLQRVWSYLKSQEKLSIFLDLPLTPCNDCKYIRRIVYNCPRVIIDLSNLQENTKDIIEIIELLRCRSLDINIMGSATTRKEIKSLVFDSEWRSILYALSNASIPVGGNLPVDRIRDFYNNFDARIFDKQRWTLRRFLASRIKKEDKLSDEDRSLISALPIFETYVDWERGIKLLPNLESNWESMYVGLVSVGSGEVSPSFSHLHKDIVIPAFKPADAFLLGEEFVRRDTEQADADRHLLKLLGIRSMGKAEFYRSNVFPKLSSFTQPMRSYVMRNILMELPALQREERSFPAGIKNLVFVPVLSGDGSLAEHRPCDLYDPDVTELRILLDDKFPTAPFASTEILPYLRQVGLKSSLTGEGVLYSAMSIERQSVTNESIATARSQALFDYCNIHWDQLRNDVNFNHLYKIKFLCVHQSPVSEMPWISNPVAFASPEECRPLEDGWYCSSLLSLLKKEPTSKLLKKDFGWETPISPDVVSKQLLSLANVQQKPLSEAKNRILASVIPKIYQLLHLYLNDSVRLAVIQDILRDSPCIFFGMYGFVRPTLVALQSPLNCRPYLFELPSDLHAFHDLFLALGVRERFSTSDYSSVLRGLKEKYQEKSLSTADIEMAVMLAGVMSESENNLVHGDVLLLPSSKGFLVPVVNLIYDDASWLTNDSNISMQDFEFVHPRISHSIARKLGCVSRREMLFARHRDDSLDYGLPSDAESFGQSEKLTRRLKHIIDMYSDGMGIFLELLQNADDAGASRFSLIYSRKSFPTNSLLSQTMTGFQGPSIVCMNDAAFSDADFRNLSRIGQASKLEKLSTTGRFGLGFSSVYHLTDYPCIYSSGYYVFLDPHSTHVPNATTSKPGLKLRDNEELLLKFKDQFIPFQKLRGYFPKVNTIFRLPLRDERSSKVSEIKQSCYSDIELGELMNSFSNVMSDSLLFLRNVRHIELYMESSDDERPRLVRECISNVVAIENNRKSLQDFVTGSDGKLSVDAFYDKYRNCPSSSIPYSLSSITTTITTMQEEYEEKWLVSETIGGDASKKLALLNPLMRFVPYAGVAARVVSPKPSLRGRAFSFLPLPLETGLPVNVNGYFELTSSRRELLWNTTTDDLSGESKIKAQWNESLIKDAISDAYIRLIVHVTKTTTDKSGYAVWPNLVSGPTRDLQQSPWMLLNRSIYDKIYNDIPILRIPSGYIRPSQCVFMSENEKDLPKSVKDILIKEGIPLVTIPLFTLKQFCMNKLHPKYVSPRLVREVIKVGYSTLLEAEAAAPVPVYYYSADEADKTSTFISAYESHSHRMQPLSLDHISREEMLDILLYCLGDQRYQELIGAKLLPLIDKSFAMFKSPSENANYYIISVSEFDLISKINISSAFFIDPIVDSNISSILSSSLLQKETNVKTLTPAVILSLLQDANVTETFEKITSDDRRCLRDYFSSNLSMESKNELSEDVIKLKFLRSLPIYEVKCNIYNTETEFVSLVPESVIPPRGFENIICRQPFCCVNRDGDISLLKFLDVPSVQPSVFFLQHVFPILPTIPRDVHISVVRSLFRLLPKIAQEDGNFIEKMKTAAFFPTSDPDYSIGIVSELFIPTDSLRKLRLPRYFPAIELCTPDFLPILEKLGIQKDIEVIGILKTAQDIATLNASPEDAKLHGYALLSYLNTNIKMLEDMEKKKDEEATLALKKSTTAAGLLYSFFETKSTENSTAVQVTKHMETFNNVLNSLQTIPWVPVAREAPPEDCLPWSAKSEREHLSAPIGTRPRSELWLASSCSRFIDFSIEEPSSPLLRDRVFRWTSPLHANIVAVQLLNISGEMDYSRDANVGVISGKVAREIVPRLYDSLSEGLRKSILGAGDGGASGVGSLFTPIVNMLCEKRCICVREKDDSNDLYRFMEARYVAFSNISTMDIKSTDADMEMNIIAEPDVRPYLFICDPLFSDRYRLLFASLGVKLSFSVDDYVSVLDRIGILFPTRVSTEAIRICVMIAVYLASVPQPPSTISLPDDQCIMCPSSSLTYNDAPWMMGQHNNSEVIRFVHPDIPIDVAEKFNSVSFRSIVVSSKLTTEIPCVRPSVLHTLLSSVSPHVWLADTIEVADILGAKTFRMIMDSRKFGDTSILFRTMSAYQQCPSIVLYFDKKMSSEEVARLLQGDRTYECQGQHVRSGIGLAGLFILGDLVSIITGSDVYLFDPSGKILSDSGTPTSKVYSLLKSDLPKRFPDTFACFRPWFSPEEPNFSGTVIRIPLMASLESFHRNTTVNMTNIENFVNGLKTVGGEMLLFLRSLEDLSIQRFSDFGEFHDLYHWSIKNNGKEDREKRKHIYYNKDWQKFSLFGYTPLKAFLTLAISFEDYVDGNGVQTVHSWLVRLCVGAGNSRDYARKLEKINGRHVVPIGGVSACLSYRDVPVTGRLFAPMPSMDTGLSVHIFGCFEMETVQRILNPSLREWNHVGCFPNICESYTQLLTDLCQLLPPDRRSSMAIYWPYGGPRLSPTLSLLIPPLLTKLSTLQIYYSPSHRKFEYLKDGYVGSAIITGQVAEFVSSKFTLFQLDPQAYSDFNDAGVKSAKLFSPLSMRQYLLSNSNQLPKGSSQQDLTLLLDLIEFGVCDGGNMSSVNNFDNSNSTSDLIEWGCRILSKFIDLSYPVLACTRGGSSCVLNRDFRVPNDTWLRSLWLFIYQKWGNLSVESWELVKLFLGSYAVVPINGHQLCTINRLSYVVVLSSNLQSLQLTNVVEKLGLAYVITEFREYFPCEELSDESVASGILRRLDKVSSLLSADALCRPSDLTALSIEERQLLFNLFLKYFISQESVLTNVEKTIIASLPLFELEHREGNANQISNYTHITIQSFIFSPPPGFPRCAFRNDDVDSWSFLKFDDATEGFLIALGVTQFVASELLSRISFSPLNWPVYSTMEQECIIDYVMKNWNDLKSENLIESMKKVPFADGCCPADLFDPSNDVLSTVFEGRDDMFPRGRWGESSRLEFLRQVGLQTSAAPLLCAAYIASLKQTLSFDQLRKRAAYFTKYFCSKIQTIAMSDGGGINTSFLSKIGTFDFVPGTLPDGSPCLCQFSNILIKKNYHLGWTMLPTVEDQYIPSEFVWTALGIKKDLPIPLVISHVQRIAAGAVGATTASVGGNNAFTTIARHGPLDNWTYPDSINTVYSTIFEYFQLRIKSISNVERQKLSDIRCIPVANEGLLLRPCHVFFKSEELHPFFFKPCDAFLPKFMELFKFLGVRDVISASDYYSVLRDLYYNRQDVPLTINELQACIKIIDIFIKYYQQPSLEIREISIHDLPIPDSNSVLRLAKHTFYLDSNDASLFNRIRIPAECKRYLINSKMNSVLSRASGAFGISSLSQLLRLSVCGIGKQQLPLQGSKKPWIASVLSSSAFAKALFILKSFEAVNQALRYQHVASVDDQFTSSLSSRLSALHVVVVNDFIIIKLFLDSIDVTSISNDSHLWYYDSSSPSETKLWIYLASGAPYVTLAHALNQSLNLGLVDMGCVAALIESGHTLLNTSKSLDSWMPSTLLVQLGVLTEQCDVVDGRGDIGAAVSPLDRHMMIAVPLHRFLPGEVVAVELSNNQTSIHSPQYVYGKVLSSARDDLLQSSLSRVTVLVDRIGTQRTYPSSQLNIFNAGSMPASSISDVSVGRETRGDDASQRGNVHTTASSALPMDNSSDTLIASEALSSLLSRVGMSLDASHAELLVSNVRLKAEVESQRRGLLAADRMLQDVNDKLLKYKEFLECGICLNRNSDIALVPCGHLLCGQCHGHLQQPKCPFCRTPFSSSVPFYKPA